MKKIAVIRFSSIGDIVLTTPVIRCVKKKYPDAELHFVTKKNFASILEHNPYLQKIHTLDGDFKRLAKELQSENFDFIVDLHHSLRSRRLLLKLQKPSASFKKLSIQKWLLVKTKLNLLPTVHVVERYLKTVEKLDVKNDFLGADFFIDPNITLPEYVDSFLNQPHVLALAVGSKHATKQIPVSIIRELLDITTFSLILLGDKNDVEKAMEIIPGFENRILSACGKLSLQQSALVLTKCQGLITGDTGLMHIASALKIHVFSFWGNTVTAFGMYPYTPNNSKLADVFEVKNLKCRPCSKLGYKNCPKGHFKCMLNQDVRTIAHKIDTHLLYK